MFTILGLWGEISGTVYLILCDFILSCWFLSYTDAYMQFWQLLTLQVHLNVCIFHIMYTDYTSIGGDYGGGLQMEWLSVHWSHYTKYSTGGFCGQCKAVVGTKFYCDIIS